MQILSLLFLKRSIVSIKNDCGLSIQCTQQIQILQYFSRDSEAFLISHLQLCSTVLAADHVPAGAESSVDLLLATQHAQQRLPQFLKFLLQQLALPAAPAVQRPLLVARRRAGRRGALPRPRHHVHDTRVV